MRALLVNAPWYKENPSIHGVRSGCRWPWYGSSGYLTFPFHMAYAASYLLSKSVDTHMIDAIALGLTRDAFYGRVRALAPDVVVFETSTTSWNNDYPIICELSKTSKICLVGTHVAAFTDKLIQDPHVTYIVKGEYEKGVHKIVCGGEKGIYDFDLVTDLDSVPWPTRTPDTIYRYSDYFVGGIKEPQVYVWGSRGCISKCQWCLWPHTMSNKTLRLRSPQNILDEVKYCINQFGMKSILFDDDAFNIGDKRIQEIAHGMAQIGVQWTAMVRLDSCTRETFKVMKDCGCYALKTGVETFSQHALDIGGKKIKADEMIDTIHYLKSLGFQLFLSAMQHVPGETDDDRNRTIRLLDGFGVRYQHPWCTPFPGTPFYHDMIAKGFKLDDPQLFDAYDAGTHHDAHAKLTEMVREYNKTITG